MYLGEYEIDEYIDLVATTHRFSSGAAYAATSITYRIYENGSTTEIVTDTAMTNFDTVTGFYYDRVQLTAAAGFEVGKSYVVLIQATVDGVAAISWRSFRVKFPVVDVARISGDATAADNCELMFDGTGYAGGTAKLQVDVQTIKTQTITCGAGVTVLASVGTAATSTAQTGDSYAIINGASGCVATKTVADAVKTQTDKLTFTVANQVDANIQYVNDAAVTGNGQAGTEWGPA